jgi:transposase
MSKRSRRYHAPSRKADLLRQHHVDKVSISQLCNQHQLQPSVFHTWQRHLWEHASQVFSEPKPSSREQELEAELAALRAKLARKEHVISELSEELLEAKKEAGEL